MLWLGQALSITASTVAGMSLQVWVLTRTHSTLSYALTFAASSVAWIVITPFAGWLADRLPRRVMLAASDLLAALVALAIALVYDADRLDPSIIYVKSFLVAACGTLRWPAFYALTSKLLAKDDLGRALSLTQVAVAIASLVGPPVGAWAVVHGAFGRVLYIDVVTYILAAGLTLVVTRSVTEEHAKDERRPPFFTSFLAGCRVLFSTRSTMIFLGLELVRNNIVGTVETLVYPLLTSLSNPEIAGRLMAVGGLGFLLGGLAGSVWKRPSRRARFVAFCTIGSGVTIALVSAFPVVWFITAAMIGISFFSALESSTSSSLWLSMTPNETRGRVHAATTVFDNLPKPFTTVLGGWLAERLVVGHAPGGGIVLLCAALGITLALTALFVSFTRTFRRLDDLPPPDEREGGRSEPGVKATADGATDSARASEPAAGRTA